MNSTDSRTSPGVHASRHSTHLLIWFGYLVFVIYGSLVPLDYKPMPFDQAWSIFLQTPMYQLGLESRADWIANGVLYVPVGFLTTHVLLQLSGGRYLAPLFIIAALFSTALALGVEFAQLSFPPRTVSLNDLLAEGIGSLLGVLLAAKYSGWFSTLLHALLGQPQRLVLHLAEAYLFGYVAFSLFPYDVLLSSAEIAQKLRGNGWSWLLAGDDHGTLLAALKLVSEVILTLPFGLYLGYRSTRRSAKLGQAALLGILLGGFIELAQFFIASGVSQGFSVLSRAAGVSSGLMIWQRGTDGTPEKLMAIMRRHTLTLGLLYLLALLLANGWFTYPWQGLDHAMAQLHELRFLPFYYHYFTTEAKALFSLASVCLMYLPIGLLAWSSRRSPAATFFLAMVAACIVEGGKLFLQGMHPDPTNIILGALAAWGGIHLVNTLVFALLQNDESYRHTGEGRYPASESNRRIDPDVRHSPPTTAQPAGLPSLQFLLWPLLGITTYVAATFPVQPLILILCLATAATAVWLRPGLFALLLLAALPALDLAQWSGRFYLDEFDLLMVTCLAIGFLRVPATRAIKHPSDVFFSIIGGLLAISFIISCLRGLLPWQSIDANSFTNYYSPFNALRIFKGALWAYLSYRLLKRMIAAEIDIQRHLASGIVAGLALTVAAIFWERAAFGGLLNFADDYRITGPISAMHTGGAYIECFLAVATPFLLSVILQTRSWIVKIAGVVLLVATTYALMVTFSRNGYVAFGVGIIIVLFFATVRSGQWLQRSVAALLLFGTILAVALPIFTGEFAQKRLATIADDLAVRQAHWSNALNIRAPDLLTALFGTGLGRFPQTHYLFSAEGNRSGTYRLISEAQNRFLRLASGDGIFIGQHVPVEPRQNYVLKFDARTNHPNATLTLPICETWLLTSYGCMSSTSNIGKQPGEWQHASLPLASKQMRTSSWFSQRPVKLALYNGNANAIVDIDNVRLETVAGENLIRNGDFSKGMDHWFFTADNHLQWHIKSLPIGVLFDQGWLGVLAIGAFALLAIKRGAISAWQGDMDKAAALAALSGFLVVGLFDTLIDTPRFLFLLLLLGIFCAEKLLLLRPNKVES